MEFNREQIEKALECCTSETTIEFNCTECPYIRKGCNIVVMRDALALIKSQAQEIASLVDDCKIAEKLISEKGEEIARLTEENERLMREKTALECVVSTARNQAKAYTVREMQERVIAEFRKDDRMNYYIRKVLDQIAKEMLEENK